MNTEVFLMKGIPQGKYTRELREEAVRLVTEDKIAGAEVARRLSIPPSTLDHWIKAFREGRLGDIGQSYRPLTEVEIELARAKKENATLKMEVEILKKAAAYFARESLPGTRG
jgi:transposase